MIRSLAEPRPDPTLLRRLSPSMQGMPIQLSLLPDPLAATFTRTTDPVWRYFRWQAFEQRAIPWTGALAYKQRERRFYSCGTMTLAGARREQIAREALAAEWEEHLQQLQRYRSAMAGNAPERITGPDKPVRDLTPLEEWIATGQARLPEPSAPPTPPWRIVWPMTRLGPVILNNQHYVIVPSAVKRLTALEPPVFLYPSLQTALMALPLGYRIMQVVPPGPSSAPPIQVLYGAPSACRPEWESAYRVMQDMETACPDWPNFYAAISDRRAGGLGQYPPEVTAGLVRATAALGYDVVHWYANDDPRAYAGALLSRRAIRHARHTDPLPRRRLRRMAVWLEL